VCVYCTAVGLGGGVDREWSECTVLGCGNPTIRTCVRRLLRGVDRCAGRTVVDADVPRAYCSWDERVQIGSWVTHHAPRQVLLHACMQERTGGG
jgi:hypothetical protein